MFESSNEYRLPDGYNNSGVQQARDPLVPKHVNVGETSGVVVGTLLLSHTCVACLHVIEKGRTVVAIDGLMHCVGCAFTKVGA